MTHFTTRSARALTLAMSTGLLLLAGCDTDDPTSPLEAHVAFNAAMGKTDVCHRTTNGSFTKISVADAAYETHIAHGDGGIGDPVPGMAGYNFDDACQPDEAARYFPAQYFSLSRSDIVALESAMSTAAIDNSDGNRIPVGGVMVYRTGTTTGDPLLRGMYGKLVVLVSDASDNNRLTVRHETYKNDGSILISVEQVTIPGTSSYSLIAGRMVNLGIDDFWMRNHTATTRDFRPLNGAKFALIGIDPAFE